MILPESTPIPNLDGRDDIQVTPLYVAYPNLLCIFSLTTLLYATGMCDALPDVLGTKYQSLELVSNLTSKLCFP